MSNADTPNHAVDDKSNEEKKMTFWQQLSSVIIVLGCAVCLVSPFLALYQQNKIITSWYKFESDFVEHQNKQYRSQLDFDTKFFGELADFIKNNNQTMTDNMVQLYMQKYCLDHKLVLKGKYMRFFYDEEKKGAYVILGDSYPIVNSKEPVAFFLTEAQLNAMKISIDETLKDLKEKKKENES